MQTLTRGWVHVRATVRTLDPRPTNLAAFRMLIGVPLFAECELAIDCVTVPLFADSELAIHCVALTTPVNGENNEANDTTDYKQQNRPSCVDVHAATKQDEDQANGEESQQAPKATLDERRAFAVTHRSRGPFLACPITNLDREGCHLLDRLRSTTFQS
jgi:hypothetical protein